MKEIRIHGRGGQGSVVLAELIALAAWEDGKFSQAFPFLGGGGERRGKPIQAFARIDNRFIRLRSRVHEPDYIFVQDYTITKEVDVLQGLKKGGMVVINTEKSLQPSQREDSFRWIEIPASRIAIEVTGRPLMNSALLGAFSQITQEVSIQSVWKAISKQFHGELAQQNLDIAQKAFEYCQGKYK
jgi:pyruvate ferredoxin oxidoreductase gamma subunit